MKPPRHHGQGLIECLCYLSVALIIMNLGGALIVRSFLVNRQLNRVCDNLALVMRAGEHWRHEVRTGGPASLDDGVFLLPDASGDGPIAYRLRGRTLERRVADGAWQRLVEPVAASRFIQDELPGVTAWRWEVELASPSRSPGFRTHLSFIAVPPGGGS